MTAKKKGTASADAGEAKNAQAAEMTYETTRVPPRLIAGYRRSLAEVADASTTETETVTVPEQES